MNEWLTLDRVLAFTAAATLVLLFVALWLARTAWRDKDAPVEDLAEQRRRDEELIAALRTEFQARVDSVERVFADRLDALDERLYRIAYPQTAERHDKIPDYRDPDYPDDVDPYDGLPPEVVDTGAWVTDTPPLDWLPVIECPPGPVVDVVEETQTVPYIAKDEVAPIFHASGEYPTLPGDDPAQPGEGRPE